MDTIKFSVQDLMHTNTVKEIEQGRCTVSQIKTLKPLVLGSTNDRKWKGKYLFVQVEPDVESRLDSK